VRGDADVANVLEIQGHWVAKSSYAGAEGGHKKGDPRQKVAGKIARS
jgi:hypothetical protein